MQASGYMVIIQIGSHTFHLHEIYGLSSASTQSTVPAVNPTAYTYPPTSATPAEDEPSSECLVCLSSPREVVLLPCRHLVACKECAINMVEFGAGGAIMHAEEPTTNLGPQPTETTETPVVDDSGPPAVASRPVDDPTSEAVPENGVGNAESPAVEPSQAGAQPARDEEQAASSASPPTPGPTAQVPPSAPALQNPRRKRRAKGWTCPVCRQREYPSSFYAPKYVLIGFGDLVSFYSVHVSPADHHFTTDGRWQGRKALLDVDRRPPAGDYRSSDSGRCYRADGAHSRLRVDAGGASGTCACATPFTAAGVLPWTLASQCRTCITCLTGNPIQLVTSSSHPPS